MQRERAAMQTGSRRPQSIQLQIALQSTQVAVNAGMISNQHQHAAQLSRLGWHMACYTAEQEKRQTHLTAWRRLQSTQVAVDGFHVYERLDTERHLMKSASLLGLHSTPCFCLGRYGCWSLLGSSVDRDPDIFSSRELTHWPMYPVSC